MNKDEFKEIMEEIYKFLKDKIVTRLGESLNEFQKEKLYSFDTNKQIIVNNISNKIIEYDFKADTLNISDGFLEKDNIEKIKLKHSDFELEKLKSKIFEGTYSVFTEELILFNEDLKIQLKDIIKSLYLQEILKRILLDSSKSIEEQTIIESFIELISHEIGSTNGFIVSTQYKNSELLKIGIDLNEELGKKFENYIFSSSINSIFESVNNKKLLKLIESIVDEKRIIESTQNLDEVIDSINEIVEEVSQISIIEISGNQIVKFVDENEESILFESDDNDKIVKAYHDLKKEKADNEKVKKSELIKILEEYNRGHYNVFNPIKEKIELAHANDEKFENSNMSVATTEGSYVKEAIVKMENDDQIDESNAKIINELKEKLKGKQNKKEKQTEINQLSEKFKQNSDSLTLEELEKITEHIKSEEKDTKIIVYKPKKVKILIYVLIVLVTIILGIFVGWILFNFRK